MDFKSYLKKLRALPDKQKKIILWTIVVILGLIMGFFWLRGAINSFSKMIENTSNIQLSEIEIENPE